MRENNSENPDSQPDERGAATLRWLLSMPPVARPLIAALALLWWACFLTGIWVENYQLPGQPWWLDVWKGSLGNNGFSAFGALLLKFLLTSEVTIMIFTLAGNKRRVKDAAAKARREGVTIGRQEGIEIGRQEGVETGRQEGVEIGRQEIRQQMAEWYESAMVDLEAGRRPEPPPISGENGNKSG